MSYRTLLAAHDKLMGKGNGNLYERIKLLRQVYEDKDFRKDTSGKGENPNTFMDEKVSDTCCNFPELLGILKLFPNKEQWVNGNLGGMRRQMLATLNKGQEEDRRKDNSDRKLSWKDKYIALEEKYKLLEARYKQLEKDHLELSKAIRRKAS